MGTLRIHFTADDVARTQIAAHPDALWETVASVHRLQTTEGHGAYREWHATVRDDLRKHNLGADLREVLRPLMPRSSYWPDFLTPPAGLSGFEAGMDALVHTPAARFDRDLDHLARTKQPPAWAEGLRTGKPEAIRRLEGAMRRYFEVAVAPYWETVVARAAADRAYRGHAVLEGGLAAMFSSLPSMIEWEAPILRVLDYPVDGDLHLEGRGITLIPSYFCWRSPTALADRDLPPVLVYPARTPLDAAVERTSEPLRALLGGTRAAILKALSMSRTTTELSRQLAIAPGTASHHVTALRSAGLVASQRQANLVLHQLTRLGGALLAQDVTGAEESRTAPKPWLLR